jgi:ABC-2 type transport system ATP-binding protein
VILLEQGRVVQRYNPAESSRATDLPFKIPARLEGKVVLVNPAEIAYVSAEEGRTALHLADGQEIATHFTLNELEERLGRSGFFRAHRGYLVNLQRVKEVVTYTRDSFTLVLESTTNAGRGPEIPLSKTAARELRQLLGY